MSGTQSRGANSPPRTPSFTVRPVSAAELSGTFLDQALSVFGGALGYPGRHARVTGFANTVQRHTRVGGFRAFGAIDSRGKLVGFSYGYSSVPGLWWREEIARALSTEQRSYWLDDAFEFAELHVHPSAQGRRLGSRLHDALIATSEHRTALLSVMHRSLTARRLYQRRGWETLVQDLRFTSEPATPFSLLGLTV